MAKIYVKTNFVILSAVAALLGTSFLGDAAAQSMMPIDTYGSAPYQSTNSHNLGTMRQSEMNGQEPTSAPQYAQQAPNYTAQGRSDEVMQPMQAGDINYVTGGIGDEERAALHAVESQYNLRVMSASNDGAFVGDTHLVIRNHRGDTLLDAVAGPLFFAKLPYGTYFV